MYLCTIFNLFYYLLCFITESYLNGTVFATYNLQSYCRSVNKTCDGILIFNRLERILVPNTTLREQMLAQSYQSRLSGYYLN